MCSAGPPGLAWSAGKTSDDSCADACSVVGARRSSGPGGGWRSLDTYVSQAELEGNPMLISAMPLLLVFVLGILVFALVAFVAWHYPSPLAEPTPSLAAAKAVGTEIGHHSRLRRTIKSRLNPEAATGLALTIGLVVIVIGGLVLGGLAVLVRSNSSLLHVDGSVAKLGQRAPGPVSDRGLNIVTQLGGVWLVTLLAVAVAIVGYVRRPNRWIPVFLARGACRARCFSRTASRGFSIASGRRSTPSPPSLGPSFPSGHSTAAAAFYAAAALILGRGASPRTRALLAGGAAGIAVAVASTRVMLDVHWLSDVIAGLALGWAWFAVCSIAFGGRMLSFGAPAKKAMQEADAEAARLPPSSEQARTWQLLRPPGRRSRLRGGAGLCGRPTHGCGSRRKGKDCGGITVKPRSAVAALVLLARPAPARVVAADVLVLVHGRRLRERLRRGRRRSGERGRGATGGGDDVGARARSRARSGASPRGSAPARARARSTSTATWKSVKTTSSTDRLAELLEHHVALAAVLDERILLGERAEVDALAEVVHRLEVLAPALVDGLEDDEALDLARELGAERLLALVVGLERVVDELLGQRLALRDVDLLAQLLDRDVRVVERLHRRHEPVEIPLLRVLASP